MIGFFPDPYPDELLYSVCARYAQRVNYPNKFVAIEDLFGRRGLSAIIDFPTRLDFLLSVIPIHNYSADEIINKNTLFPFYQPFIAPERALKIREEMKGLNNNHLRTRLATNISQVKMPEHLRFCSLCLVEDRKLYGETYWHRIHQIAGVLVCPKHKCFLHNSQIKWERESSYLFFSAENLLTEKKPNFLDNKNFAHQIFFYLSIEARWLLSQKDLTLDQGELRERYHNLLLKKGFAFYNGKIRSNELFVAFTNFYKSKILEKLGCALNSSYDSWLSRLVDKTYTNILYHPIRHLLLLKFLGIMIEELFTAFIEFKPFNSPPYPCLNKTAQHYKELRIQSCKISDNRIKKSKIRRPIAVFICDCGFSYQRSGPDISQGDIFRYDIVRNYGDVWESKLTKDWSDLNLSLSAIARKFETSTCLITRHAIRLNLPMNTEGTRKAEGYSRYRNPELYLADRIKLNRKKWLETVKKHPIYTRRKLLNKFNTLYLWMQKNDSLWFEHTLPKPQKSYRRIELLDWRKIDKDLCIKIQEACKKIRKKLKLTRVSITEIIRRVGYKNWIEKRHLKLPKTTNLINEQLESLEDFMLRKLKVAEKYYIAREIIPSHTEIVRRASIYNTTTLNSSKIQNEINESINKIIRAVERD